MGKKGSTARTQAKKKIVKVVFDTNIWVSLALNKRLAGSFKPIMDDKKHFEILISNQILSEFACVLTCPKISGIFEKPALIRELFSRVFSREFLTLSLAVC